MSSGQNRLTQRFDKYRDRPLVDLGLLIYQRDRESAGSVLGSAVAFRMFLFVPLLLFVVGLAGFVATWVDADSVNDGASITGTLAAQIDTVRRSNRAAHVGSPCCSGWWVWRPPGGR